VSVMDMKRDGEERCEQSDGENAQGERERAE